MYYIGIDLGTSAVKLLLVDEKGQIYNEITKEYPGQLFVSKTKRIYNQKNENLTLLSANVRFLPVPAICPIGHKMYLWGISLPDGEYVRIFHVWWSI